MPNSPNPRASAGSALALGRVHLLLLGIAAVFLALHFVHLAADFPNQSRWMDWSKYTDEGWYGDAAIRHFQLGHWYVPGDFNPAAALPVWPALEALVFLFTGVSLVAARALSVGVFGGILIASWSLIHRTRPSGCSTAYSASAAVLLLALSPFCFVFTRLAIIEPLLVLLTLLALLIATLFHLPPHIPGSSTGRMASGIRFNLTPILLLGLLLPVMVLTKTTAIFLFPAVAWMLFAAAGYRVLPFFRLALPVGIVAITLWLGWFLLVIRPHFLADYRYLFSANAYTGITRKNAGQVLLGTVKYGMWIGRRLYPLACLAIFIALLNLRRLRSHPLIPALLLWVFGYAAFLAYHNNLQPRYYLVVAIPLTLLVAVVPERLVLPSLHSRAYHPVVVALLACLALIALPDTRELLGYVRYPQYTLLTAARQVRDYIAADRRVDPAHNPLILSISGSDLSLMTGLPSICDDFGTLELPDRVKRYRPGWYVAWNQIDDDKMDAMTPLFQPVRVATFPAMDDPDRNVLVLYRLDAPGTAPSHRHALKPIPRSLRTRLGQQPSTNQLVH